MALAHPPVAKAPFELTLLGGCAVGAACFVPIGVAPFNVCVALACVAWLIGLLRAPQRGLRLLREPIVQGALGFFALYALSLIWTEAARAAALKQLGSYRVLLFPALFVPVLADPRWRARTLWGLLAGLTAVLLLSWVQWWHPLPFARASHELAGQVYRDAYVFSDRIRQSIHLGALVWWCAGVVLCVYPGWVGALGASSARSQRLLWLGAAGLLGLGLINMLWLVKGRTAWLVVSILALYALGVRFGRRGSLVALVWCGATALAVSVGADWLGERMAATVTEARDYLALGASNATGERLAMWSHAWGVIQTAPWWGHGIESYPGLSAQFWAALGQSLGFLHHDPHQEWLYVAVELGLVGVLMLAAGLMGLWRLAGRFDAEWRWLARGFVLLYLAAGLVNGVLNLAWTGYFFGLLLALVAGRHAQARGWPAVGVAVAERPYPQGAAS